MASGYGNRIYKKRKKRWFPPVIFALIFGAVLFLWLSKKDKRPREEAPAAADVQKKISDIIDSDREDDSPVFDQFESGEQEETDVDTSGPAENSGLDATIRDRGKASPVKGRSQLRLSRARVYVQKRKYRKAIEIYETMADADTAINLEKGQCYYFIKEYENALNCFQKALLSDPTHFMAGKFLAFTLYRLEQFELSLEYAREALSQKRDPELESLMSRVSRERELMKDYTDKQTSNFTITFSRIEHSDIKFTVIDILNDAYRTVGNQINHFPDSAISVVLYNERNFFDITRSPAWAGGLFDGKIKIPIKRIKGREALLKRVLIHEFVHALVHDLTPSCPLWMDEGLAEYFSGPHPRDIGQVIPLNRLEKNFPFRDIRMLGLAYLESYSAVHYLISKFGMYRIRELLEALGKGIEFPKAFETVFLISYREFLNTWGKS